VTARRVGLRESESETVMMQKDQSIRYIFCTIKCVPRRLRRGGPGGTASVLCRRRAAEIVLVEFCLCAL